MTRRALIFGIGGQDGSYLARWLLQKGYVVHGTSRGPGVPENLRRLGLGDEVSMHQIDPSSDAVAPLLGRAQPDEIYYLAAQSSVWRSFADPVQSFRISAKGLIAVIEAARAVVPDSRILNAASGDCFGPTRADAPANEDARFAPRSPYAAAKCAGHHAVAVARLAYGQFASSAFLFNHESPLRTEDFAIGKIIAAAKRIADGSDETLELGNLDVVRDWGWAPDYVEAMWAMLQQPEALDLVIATGRSRRLEDLVAAIFNQLGLHWRDHVQAFAVAPRPTDIVVHHADPSRAKRMLGWSPLDDLDTICARLLT